MEVFRRRRSFMNLCAAAARGVLDGLGGAAAPSPLSWWCLQTLSDGRHDLGSDSLEKRKNTVFFLDIFRTYDLQNTILNDLRSI